MSSLSFFSLLFFFFNDTATTEIYTLSLHDALPISDIWTLAMLRFVTGLGLGAAMPNAVTLMSEYCPDSRRATLTNAMFCGFPLGAAFGDRKSTRLNSSHLGISYAVFCLIKKKLKQS